MLPSELIPNQIGQLSSIVYFSSPMIITYQIIHKKKELKDFPLTLIGMKFIAAILISTFLIGTRSRSKNLDLVYFTLYPLSSNGLIISLFFSIFYLIHYLNLDKIKQIIYTVCCIIGLFILEVLVSLIMLIPIISHLLFLIGYTMLIISPFYEGKKIYANWDYNLIPFLDIHSCAIMAFFIGFFLRNIKDNNWELFVIEFNLFICICEIVFYYYLYYKGPNQNQNQNDNKNNIDENLLSNNNNNPNFNTNVESKSIEEVNPSNLNQPHELNVPSTGTNEGNLQTLDNIITPSS